AFVMDYLKTRAPFWKEEARGDARRWVEAADKDTAAKARWDE
ncbi:MAG TPA: molybdopterin synthase catalytic subunit MoaE, partial [Rhizomicrobium sp.]